MPSQLRLANCQRARDVWSFTGAQASTLSTKSVQADKGEKKDIELPANVHYMVLAMPFVQVGLLVLFAMFSHIPGALCALWVYKIEPGALAMLHVRVRVRVVWCAVCGAQHPTSPHQHLLTFRSISAAVHPWA